MPREVSWGIPHAVVEADDLLKPIKKIKSSSKNYVQSFCKCFETQRLRSALSRSCEIQLHWMEAMCEDRAGPQPVWPGWAVMACVCSMSSGRQGVHLNPHCIHCFHLHSTLNLSYKNGLGCSSRRNMGHKPFIYTNHCYLYAHKRTFEPNDLKKQPLVELWLLTSGLCDYS